MEIKEKVNFSLKNSTWKERFSFLAKSLSLSEEDLSLFLGTPSQEVADLMIESAIGYMPVPLGLVWDFPINQKNYYIPIATEEPSVIAAANYMSKLFSKYPISSQSSSNILSGQVYVKSSLSSLSSFLEAEENSWKSLIKKNLFSMEKRGGGFSSYSIREIPSLGLVSWDIYIDTCDAQGANIINSLLETLGSWLEEKNYKVILKILSNDLSHSLNRASFKLPLSYLDKWGYNREVIDKLILIGRIASLDSKRASTHNKGIMNGISGLALATGNDTRALESAVYSFAATKEGVMPLTSYELESDFLIGRIEIPLSLATIGGGTSHPIARFSQRILGVSSASELKEVAASLGLAQNLAALLALSSEGIQKGHMRLHERKKGKL